MVSETRSICYCACKYFRQLRCRFSAMLLNDSAKVGRGTTCEEQRRRRSGLSVFLRHKIEVVHVKIVKCIVNNVSDLHCTLQCFMENALFTAHVHSINKAQDIENRRKY